MTDQALIKESGSNIVGNCESRQPNENESDLLRVGDHVFQSRLILGSGKYESFEVMKAGKVKDKQVVTHTFPLDRINEAFDTAVNTNESIKVMIEP